MVSHYIKRKRSLWKPLSLLEKMGIIQCMVWEKILQQLYMSFFLLVLQSEKVRFLVAGAEISQSQKREKKP